MKSDVLAWAAGKPTSKLVSKETLNHRGIIEMVSGLDVYENTPEAYKRAYEALGIDIINRVPTENAPPPTPPGEVTHHPTKPYNYAALGVYDTVNRHTYPVSTPERVWDLDVASMEYEDLVNAVPHPPRRADIVVREAAIGDVGLYYPMLYTTLFMWGVEALGWETLMLVGALEPDRFHEEFLLPCKAKSIKIVAEMASASNSPLLFVHDDLAAGDGPVFNPVWYDKYILPHYPDIFRPALDAGKKVFFVADGNMTHFLPKLWELGVSGIQFENPATPIEEIIKHFGDGLMMGGIETAKLTFGMQHDVRRMVLDLHELTRDLPGFAMSCCGGLHGNIPLPNLEAYFDARAEIGVTPPDWRTRCRA